MEHNKLVYIASPYSGDVERNVAFAKAACRYAMNQGVTPIASHLLYPQMLDDGVPSVIIRPSPFPFVSVLHIVPIQSPVR